jgi:hypothetical protein
MRIEINEIICQLYLLPTVKVTYDKWLNGRYEVIICFLKWELSIYKEKK